MNGLFERIYSESNPDVRRAMNKSFTESGIIKWTRQMAYRDDLSSFYFIFKLYVQFGVGGTVLSTNWNEVGSQKVEVKPPTGTEFRPWTE